MLRVCRLTHPIFKETGFESGLESERREWDGRVQVGNEGICKSFPGVKALDGINLRVRPGTVHALMGENGAGKSTLMKCLFGIYKMDEGEIYLDGEKMTILNPDDALHKGLAMVHQELQPIPERTIAENMYLGRYPLKSVGPLKYIDHKTMNEEAAKWLENIKMPYDPKAKLGTLSIAQMQSVEIAKAVIHECESSDPGRADVFPYG